MIATLAALLLLLAALGTVAQRNLIRSTLALALAFAALGALFVSLGAEFAGLVQVLVNVGAVAVLIAFVVLITRPDRITVGTPAGSVWAGAACALALGGLIGFAVLTDPIATAPGPDRPPAATVASIGRASCRERV